MNHAVERSDFAIGIGEQREVQRGSLRLSDVTQQPSCLSIESTETPITFYPAAAEPTVT
jgi:hypothetical protein